MKLYERLTKSEAGGVSPPLFKTLMIELKYNTEIDIATANSSNTAKWRNTRTTWADLLNTLAVTQRTSETIKQYFGYKKDKQDAIKDVGGFVGGYLREGRRRNGHVEYRQVVALDVDFGDLDLWIDFGKLGFAGCMYTTHKHTPENPRFRIVFPLDRKVSPDEYEALARQIADCIGIDHFDDSTFQPTRLMYYPSTAKDGEFVFNYADAPIMDADFWLDTLIDWRDPTTWAYSSRVKEIVKRDTSTLEDPEEKDGVIGAFCRAYCIDAAIAEFLPDVYAPCEELGANRYSFAGGSTSGGLVVYDGKVAYSHHSTDPISSKACNAFDLVRLHKFGDLDEKAKPDTDITRLPSYKAMTAFAAGLTPVKNEIIRERRSKAADDYDDLAAEAVKTAEAEDWIAELEMEGKNVKQTIGNALLIFNNDPAFRQKFSFDEFSQREQIASKVIWDKPDRFYPRNIIDADEPQIRLYMERAYELTHKGNIEAALTICVRDNSFDPVKEFIGSVEWDSVQRAQDLFIKCLGAADTPYTRTVTELFLVGAVARVFNPGVKFDYVPVLVGEQGIGKSTILARLGGKWFSDSVSTIDGREAVEQLQGAWIVELGELGSLRRADVDKAKHFFSKTTDRFRVAYGKRVEDFPRRCVFIGTTNEVDFLRDVTGNRRFLPIQCNAARIETSVFDYMTPETVAQIWAEALRLYKAGYSLYLDRDTEKEAQRIQDGHLETDDRSGLVAEYLARLLPEKWEDMDVCQRRTWLEDKDNVGTVERESVCVLEIWAECFGNDPNRITRKDSFEISRLLKGLRGWKFDGSKRSKLYGKQKMLVKEC